MPSKPFNQLVIALSGTFPGYKQGRIQSRVFTSQFKRYSMNTSRADMGSFPADLKAIIDGQGASFTSAVGTDCTHLITTSKEVEKNGTKCE